MKMTIKQFRKLIRQQAQNILKQGTVIQDIANYKTKMIQKILKTIKQLNFQDIQVDFNNKGMKETAINNVKQAFEKLIKDNKFQLYKNKKA